MDTRTWLMLLATLSLLAAPLGCPADDDDDSSGDDDAGDDDAADDDAGDDDTAGTDADGDGFTDDVDCDDNDADVNPDATEYCYDEVDNNCDGDVDADDADDCALNDTEIEVTGDGASLTVPAGAVMGDVELTIESVEDPRLPDDCSPLTAFYAILPPEVLFQIGVPMQLPSNVPQPEVRALSLLIYSPTSSEFAYAKSPVTDLGGLYQTNITRAGLYVIADCNPPG
jgi:hypothetical protein